MSAPLAVIVVNHNGGSLLARCVESIKLAIAQAGLELPLVVVDNASSDGSAQALAGVELVELATNRGFGAGANAGIAATDSEWVALINPDATLAPAALAAFLSARAALGQEVGVLAAQIRFASDRETLNSAGLVVDELGVAYERLVGQPASAAQAPASVFGASAGGCFLRRAMLEQVGLFDERFFLYFEDVDLCWRAQGAGWQARYEPAIVVYHEHSAFSRQGSPLKLYNVGRNRVRTLAKNAPATLLRRRLAQILLFDSLYVLFGALRLRSLAPARGRFAGLREWREFRPPASPPPAPLAPPSSLLAALARRRFSARNSWSARNAPARYPRR